MTNFFTYFCFDIFEDKNASHDEILSVLFWFISSLSIKLYCYFLFVLFSSEMNDIFWPITYCQIFVDLGVVKTERWMRSHNCSSNVIHFPLCSEQLCSHITTLRVKRVKIGQILGFLPKSIFSFPFHHFVRFFVHS